MAVVLVVSLIVTHGLKVEHPGRGQLLLENAVTWLQGIGEGILGEEGKGYAPYLTSVLMLSLIHISFYSLMPYRC